MRNAFYLLTILLLISCSESKEVSLKEFNLIGDVFDSGKRLMSPVSYTHLTLPTNREV